MFAIAGLANNFKARMGGKDHVAGIWYDELKEIEAGEDWEPQTETALDLLWRLAYLKDPQREHIPVPAVPIPWSWASPECPVVDQFSNDQVFNQYSLVASMGGAANFSLLPDDYEKPREWVKGDM
ncbi:hypothetical protein CCMA1212_009813 [Trichoderma ghanense]|uniref:Uncharacterized protein n=1 Tax=Trichoderma ghanense TaxID=65468 RepID=A0ABY2GS69_9HYPO